MERIVSDNGVVYYRSELIPCKHGFATRIGGISVQEHTKGLNLGIDRGDAREVVIKNLELFSEAVGIDPTYIISVSQVHSDKVRYVTEENRGEGFFVAEQDSCDGYITDKQGIALGIRTADCVPILMYAPKDQSFSGAVMAVHAGWRGTAKKIAAVAVKKAVELGADPKTIKVAIGPSIDSCCYEVRQDFYDEFSTLTGKKFADKFVCKNGKADSYYADLKSANRQILLDTGILPENIDVSDMCTCCNPNEFFSHRYSRGKRGTMLSVISMENIKVIHRGNNE